MRKLISKLNKYDWRCIPQKQRLNAETDTPTYDQTVDIPFEIPHFISLEQTSMVLNLSPRIHQNTKKKTSVPNNEVNASTETQRRKEYIHTAPTTSAFSRYPDQHARSPYPYHKGVAVALSPGLFRPLHLHKVHTDGTQSKLLENYGVICVYTRGLYAGAPNANGTLPFDLFIGLVKVVIVMILTRDGWIKRAGRAF